MGCMAPSGLQANLCGKGGYSACFMARERCLMIMIGEAQPGLPSDMNL